MSCYIISYNDIKNTGYGLHILDESANMGYSEMASLKRTNSVFQADACGIKPSQWNTKNRDIIFYSDSQATIKSLQKN